MRNPTLNKIDNADILINQINEAIEPLKEHDKININQNIETIQYKEVEFIDENIKPIEDFINPKTDLDIFYDDKPLEIIKNESLIYCSVCKNNVKSYNTWNTLKKCFICKECNKQGMLQHSN